MFVDNDLASLERQLHYSEFEMDEEDKACGHCGQQFHTYEMAIRHENMMLEREDYCCPTEEEVLIDWARDQGLMPDKEEGRRKKYPQRCPTCDKGFYQKIQVTRHLEENRACLVATWPHKCSGCKERFRFKKYLIAHRCCELSHRSSIYFSGQLKSASRIRFADVDAGYHPVFQREECEYCENWFEHSQREAHMQECVALDEKISTRERKLFRKIRERQGKAEHRSRSTRRALDEDTGSTEYVLSPHDKIAGIDRLEPPSREVKRLLLKLQSHNPDARPKVLAPKSEGVDREKRRSRKERSLSPWPGPSKKTQERIAEQIRLSNLES